MTAIHQPKCDECGQQFQAVPRTGPQVSLCPACRGKAKRAYVRQYRAQERDDLKTLRQFLFSMIEAKRDDRLWAYLNACDLEHLYQQTRGKHRD